MSSSVNINNLEYSDLKEDELEEVIQFVGQHFYPREPVSTGLHISTYEDNKERFNVAVREWVPKGVSVVAKDRTNGQIAGVCLATILQRDDPKAFDQEMNINTSMINLHKVLSALETAVDFFDLYKHVERILELAMITVSEQYGGRGVGTRLVKESENRGISKGCTLVIAQATAIPTQRIFQRLQYGVFYTLDYSTFKIDGVRIFDTDRMFGCPSAKVMARLLVLEKNR